MMENICTEFFWIRKNIWRMILVHWRKGWSQPACLPTDQVPALIATSVCAWGGAVSGGLTRIISCQCSQPGTLHFGTYSKVRYRPSGNANTCPGSPWSLQGPLPPSTSADQVPSCTCLLNDFSTPSVLASIETSYQSSSRMRWCDLSNRGRKCA